MTLDSRSSSEPTLLRVLVIAYHFPPLQGSSGILRTLKFIKYLGEYGVSPTVLTVSTRAYPKIDNTVLAQLPPEVEVVRAQAFDTQKHFSIKGKYPSFLSVPDRFASWIPFGVIKGLLVIKRKKIQAIYSTYPVSSAHVIAYYLSRITKLPWVADFRDPMWDEFSASGSDLILNSRKNVEKKVVESCHHAIMNTPGMYETFIKRYSNINAKKLSVIPNGFDDADFKNLKRVPKTSNPPIKLIHAGLLERADRDPGPFFKALRILLEKKIISLENFRVDLVASFHEDEYHAEVKALGLEQIVHFSPSVPYQSGLQMMFEADILLLFQGPSCNEQIPAKLYEYMRIGKPILAITTSHGQTGQLVKKCEAGMVVAHDSPEEMAALLEEWMQKLRTGIPLPAATPEMAAQFSRQSQTQTLAKLLDEAVRQT